MSDASFTNRNNSHIEHAQATTSTIASTTTTSTTTTTTTTNTNTTTKPKLSLLSSTRQFAINRITSVEDQPDQKITILSSNTSPGNYVHTFNVDTQEKKQPHENLSDSTTPITTQTSVTESDTDNNGNKDLHRTNHNVINDTQQNEQENKMNITKEDLIRLLSMLKSELQSKEIALAAIKCEQLKRLINPVEISRSSLAKTYIELQDRIKAHDQNNNSKIAQCKENSSQNVSSASSTASQVSGLELDYKQRSTSEIDCNEENEKENLNILNTLLELLDRHPLLALPRDSIFCLDYNCNELSTKNYLNLKIQHLDNLISQHRRYRYYMNERLKRSEQRYLDLTRELELERNLKFENEKNSYKASGRSVLMKCINQLKEALEKEKKDKQAIVMTLLNELLDEKEKAELYARKVAEFEIKLTSNKLDETSNLGGVKELQQMQTEIESLNMQLKKQSMVFSKDREELQRKVDELESENSSLRSMLNGQEKPIATSTTKSSSTASTPDHIRESTFTSNRSISTSHKQASTTTKQSPNAPAVMTRTSITSTSSTKHTLPIKTSTSNPNPTTSNTRASSQSSAGSANNSQFLSSSRQVAANSQNAASNSSKSSAPQLISRLLGGSSSVDHTPVKTQPLLKQTSFATTNQLAKSKSPNSGNTPLIRASSVANKPQVPAKPAQLLDQQRAPP